MSNQSLTFELCNPVDREDEIKALFVRNERPDFPSVFDHRYKRGAADGLQSWIAKDPDGRVTGHVAVAPRTFDIGSSETKGAVFIDLMFDVEHRDFFSAVKLLRRARAGLAEAGSCAFAYSVAMQPVTVAFRAAGFKEIGALRRYVLPLNKWYLWGCRIKARCDLGTARAVTGEEKEAAIAELGARTRTHFRGRRSPDFYQTWLSDSTLSAREWIAVRDRRTHDETPVGLAWVEHRPEDGVMVITDLLWNEQLTSASTVLHSVAAEARRRRYKKMSIKALTESSFETGLRKCGFVARQDAVPVLLAAFSEPDDLPSRQDWLMTWVDGGTW